MKTVLTTLLVITSIGLVAKTHKREKPSAHKESSADSVFLQLRGQYTSVGASAPNVDSLNIDKSLVPILTCVKQTWSAEANDFKYEKFEAILHQFKDIELVTDGKKTVGPGLVMSTSEVGGAISQMKLPELGELRKRYRDQHAAHSKKAEVAVSPIAQPKSLTTPTIDSQDGRPAVLFEQQTQLGQNASGPRHKTKYFVRSLLIDDKPKMIIKVVQTYQPDANHPPEDHSVSYCLRP